MALVRRTSIPPATNPRPMNTDESSRGGYIYARVLEESGSGKFSVGPSGVREAGRQGYGRQGLEFGPQVGVS